MLTMFLAALDQTIVATALPTIGRQFQDVSSLSWVITAYLLASTAVAPVFGTLSDIYGRRAMIIVSAQPVHRRLGAVRAGTEHAGADPGARPAGIRRRRHHADRADRDFRRGQRRANAASIRPISAAYGWRRHRRADPRRRVRRASALVDDFLDQRAARARLAGAAAAEDGQDPGVSPQAQGRLARRRAADGLRRRVHAGADLGRQPLSLAVACHHGDDRRVRRAGARVRVACPQCRRAVPAAAADGRNGGALRDGGRRLRDGRDAGTDRASAAVLRGGLSSQRQRGRACADSAGGDLDRRRRDRRARPWPAPGITSGWRSSARRLRRWRGLRADADGDAAMGVCWRCCRCSRSGSARRFRSAWYRCRIR